MYKKGIFMPVLALLTVSIFVYALFALSDGVSEEIFVGTPIPGIFDSYSIGEVDYYNYEKIVQYSLSKTLVKSFPEIFPENIFVSESNEVGIPEDVDSFLVLNLEIEISNYEVPKEIIIQGDILYVTFNEKEYSSEFLNGDFNYKFEPVITIDLTEIKEKIEASREQS